MEKIYTIPINEAFDERLSGEKSGCPFCALRRKYEHDELELILGASMMEPEIRIKTNEKGFCGDHFGKMLRFRKRLPLALMLESHLEETKAVTKDNPAAALLKGAGSGVPEKLGTLEKSCYLCERIDGTMGKVFSNAVWLWDNDPDFRKKIDAMPYFCLPDFRAWLNAARTELKKKDYGDFYKQTSKVVNGYLDSLKDDVGWFCKKFDYRYENEPWGNAKDSVERAVAFLSGERDPDYENKQS